MNWVVFVLAAGKSKRMGFPKMIAPLGGRPMMDYALEIARSIGDREVYCVVSPEIKAQRKFSLQEQDWPFFVVQDPPLGTGHAFFLAFHAALARDPLFLTKDILVLLGDGPLSEITDVLPLLQDFPELPDAVVMGMNPPDPQGYGRLILKQGRIQAIVEARDGVAPHPDGSFCNTGVMRIRAKAAEKALSMLQPSAVTGEIYLTDLITHIPHSTAIEGPWQRFSGVNTLKELQEAERQWQIRFREKACSQGALLLAPENTFLSYDTQFSPGVRIHPYTCFGPKVIVEKNVTVYSFSVLEACRIREGSHIGPFAHIRSGDIGPYGVLGNFVEMKNTTMGYGSKAKHLSYLGDAVIGAQVNVGAGVITMNYDGHQKHPTLLEDGVSVGGNTSLIAPLTLGADSTIGAGSVITKSVPPQCLSLSRTEQKTILLPTTSKHLRRNKKIPPINPV